MNQRFCRKILHSVARAWVPYIAIVLLVIPMMARAQFTATATGSVQYEHNNNVFALDSRFAELGPNDRTGGDTSTAYQAGFDAHYLLGLQQFYATASASEITYQRFTDLDHTDYNFDTGWNWKLGDLLDGKFDVARARTEVQFLDLNQTTLSLNTTQKETALIGLKLPADWRLEGTVYTNTAKQPLPGQPDLESTETAGAVAAKYLGVAGFTMGAQVGFATGDFRGTNGIVTNGAGTVGNEDLTYHQTTAGVVVNYASGHSILNGLVGYTRRTSDTGTDDTSGVTGSIAVTDQMTPKTSVTLQLSRALNSYFLNSSAEVDSIAGVSVSWRATYKLTASAGYTFTYRQYPAQGNNPVGSNRDDAQQFVNLGLTYQPLRWLSIRPYANLQTRVSNFVGAVFSQTIVGVTVTCTTPTKAKNRK